MPKKPKFPRIPVSELDASSHPIEGVRSTWTGLPVVQLTHDVQRSIEHGLAWVVFEPNSEATWAAVRGSIEDFLITLWHGGALAGFKAQESFFVHCDRTTMTQTDIDDGRLVCLVGVAPRRPSEFEIFRITCATAR